MDVGSVHFISASIYLGIDKAAASRHGREVNQVDSETTRLCLMNRIGTKRGDFFENSSFLLYPNFPY
jgi:hypothetical protein